MFSLNYNLNFIDLSSFYSPYSDYNFFLGSNSENGTIIINRKFNKTDEFKRRNKNWNIIYKD